MFLHIVNDNIKCFSSIIRAALGTQSRGKQVDRAILKFACVCTCYIRGTYVFVLSWLTQQKDLPILCDDDFYVQTALCLSPCAGM